MKLRILVQIHTVTLLRTELQVNYLESDRLFISSISGTTDVRFMDENGATEAH